MSSVTEALAAISDRSAGLLMLTALCSSLNRSSLATSLLVISRCSSCSSPDGQQLRRSQRSMIAGTLPSHRTDPLIGLIHQKGHLETQGHCYAETYYDSTTPRLKAACM